MPPPGNRGLFEGLTVVELATVLAGPAVGQFFAELGARVVKLEPPTGDVTRTWRIAGEGSASDVSAYFSAVNWGKASVVADLKTAAGQALAHALLASADVVISNYRPSDGEKLGMAPAALQARYPRLVVAHLSGYGPTSDRGGYDALVQAESGFMYLNGTPEGPATKLPVALMDLLAAHQLKEGILAGLWQRERTGTGAIVEVSLAQAAVASLANQASAWLWLGQRPERAGSEHPAIVPYGSLFATADGREVQLAVGSDRQFADLCDVLGLPHLAHDPRYSTNARRVEHRSALKAELAAAIATQALEPLLATLHTRGVPAGALHDVPTALAQPEALPLHLVHEGLKGLRTVAWAEPQGWQAPTLSPPPNLGAHTEALRQELGLA
ncbi:MAG: CaiB/BaiF CoA-transferase family protein [Bacteroidia bacterium]|nr:CaiB/BaiF CoA-transferase family protein [Bacteroidia bacterium]